MRNKVKISSKNMLLIFYVKSYENMLIYNIRLIKWNEGEVEESEVEKIV